MKRIFVLLLTSVFALTIYAQTPQKITLEDIFVKNTFEASTVKGLRSMNDGEHYTTLENNSKIVKYSYKTGEQVDVVFDVTKVADAPIQSFSDYVFSNDEKEILLTTDKKPIYRRSFTAEYYVWNSVTSELLPLSEKGAQQLATFSPDGERVAFVRDNNIFIKNLRFGSESQVTYDGAKNKIINGATRLGL